MDRLDMMTAFVAVCEAEGFAPAARRLGISPSVVTRQVAALEERLGVRLINRTTRAIGLTEAGQSYLERARRILADVADAEVSAQGERAAPRGRLAITAPLIFGRLHVAPALACFMQQHPQVTGELHLSDHFANLIEDGHDLAIRIGHLPDSQLIARRLGETRRAVVASPDYVGRAGVPAHPSQLSDFSLIAVTTLLPTLDWHFAENGKDLRVRIAPRYATNSGDAAIQYAISGGGLTRVLFYQVRDAIAAGALVEVLGAFAPPPMPIHAVFASSRFLASKVRGFIELIESEADWRFA